ncbi:P-loop containing nucleoside triphosphate hydrolase protein [Trichoderma novae-zelandiae]
MSKTPPNNPQEAWDAAIHRAKHELGAKEFDKLLQVQDYQTCLNELQSKNKRFSRKWSRLKAVVGPVLDFLRTFDMAISSCCQSNSRVTSLVWGSVQAVLTVAAKFSKCARRISEMLGHLSQSMPRLEGYLRHFQTNDRLHLCLVSIYETFVMFCARAFRFLDSKTFTTTVRLTWSSLDKKFATAMEDMNNYRTEMDDEARAANIDLGFLREAAAEQRYQALLATIPAALKRSNLIESTVMVPHARNSTFIGRVGELDRVHEQLCETRISGDTVPSIVAVHGMGGAGKSQLALEYLFQNKQKYKGRFWIRAEDAAIIQQDFARVSNYLGPGDTGVADLKMADGTVKDLKKAVQTVKDWFSGTSEPWLLVFDNVNDATDIQEYLPTSGRGSVIVTTRDRDAADNLGQWTKTIELQGLQENEATTLLRQIDPAIPEDDLTRKIVDELGSLPLAICQMGTYIRQTKCTLDQFYNLLQSDTERLYSDTASIKTLSYSMTLARCCDMSIELLPKADIYLLGVIALFQTDEVPEELITRGCRGISRIEHLADPCNWNDAIRTLTRHSVVTASQDGSRRNLRMHRVVKRRAIYFLAAEPFSRAEAFRDAATLLNGMFPRRPPDGGTMTQQWVECELWLPHVLSLRDSSISSKQPQEGWPREYAEILCNCAWYMWERGAAHAFEFATHAADVCETAVQEDDTLLSDIYTIVGALRLVRFQLKRECLEAFQKALDIRERYMAKIAHPTLDDRRMIAGGYNNAGVGRLVLEEYSEAMRLIQKSLELKYALGDETTVPYDIGIGIYNICRIQMGQGLILEARENAKKALDLVELKNGPEDFRTNQFRFTYAELLIASGEVEEGLYIHEYTMEIRKRVMGDENNDTGVSYYGLGCLYQQLGRLEDALASIENAIKVFENVLGAEDRVARSYFRKHLILKEMKRGAESVVALGEARRYRQALVGNGDEGKDTMQDYDFLVSYYNK